MLLHMFICCHPNPKLIGHGSRLNKKKSYQYRNSHYKDTTFSRPSRLYNWNPHTWKHRRFFLLTKVLLQPSGWLDPVLEVGHAGIHGRIGSDALIALFKREWRCPYQLPLIALLARQRSATIAVAGTSSPIFTNTHVIVTNHVDMLSTDLTDMPITIGVGPYVYVEFLQDVRKLSAVVHPPAGYPTITVANETLILGRHYDSADEGVVSISVLIEVDEWNIIWKGCRDWVVAGVNHYTGNRVMVWLSLLFCLDIVSSQNNGVGFGFSANTMGSSDDPSTTDETAPADVETIALQGSLPWIFARSGVTAAHDIRQLGAQGRHQNSSQYDQELHGESITSYGVTTDLLSYLNGVCSRLNVWISNVWSRNWFPVRTKLIFMLNILEERIYFAFSVIL